MNKHTFALAILAALMAPMMVSCKSTSHHERPESQHERAGEYLDDTVITGKVKAAILNEPNLKSAEINVETFKGVVQLSGFVSSVAAQRKAVEVARRVKGVQSVKNDMRVK